MPDRVTSTFNGITPLILFVNKKKKTNPNRIYYLNSSRLHHLLYNYAQCPKIISFSGALYSLITVGAIIINTNH